MLRLVTFGGLAIESENGSPPPGVRTARLALLAVLAAAGDRGVSRDRVAALFWPDSDDARARHSLRQSLYALRTELGFDVIRTTAAGLALDAGLLSADVAEFRAAIAAGDRAGAMALARGPFLDGFHLPGASEFERWVSEEGSRLTGMVTDTLVSLATDAAKANDRDAAVAWWRRLTIADPLSGRFAAGYLAALAERGDRAAALAFARQHESLVRRELEADPDPDVQRIEAELRALPSVDVARSREVRPRAPVDAPEPPRFVPRPRTSIWKMAAGVAALMFTAVVATRAGVFGESGSRGRSPVANRLYDEGIRAKAQGDRASAQRLMRAALAEDSTFAMAAYYEALLAGGNDLPDGRRITDVRRRAMRLAAQAPERERLLITATMLQEEQEPAALAVAESLATRYPRDARAQSILGQVRSGMGDWPGAAQAFENAIALDSLVTPTTSGTCEMCDDLGRLAEAYFWWDSLPAAARTAQRFRRAYPNAAAPHWLLAMASARAGDSTAAYDAFRRFRSGGAADPLAKLDLDLILEAYADVERDVRPYLASASKDEWSRGAWALIIALRNQGRLHEAMQFHRTGTLAGFPSPSVSRAPDDFNEGILMLERGDGRASAAVFAKRVQWDMSHLSPGVQSRHRTWNATLEAMGLTAAGDTIALRALADSVETWGRGSSYGRDRKAHHYVRGLVLAAAGHHEDAAREFRAAVHSPSLGFTRVNYELARCLLALGRPREAIDVLRPALHGIADASNLYITRTALHELLAESYDRAGVVDSAAVNYRAVATAWQHADPEFRVRRDHAVRWLARHCVVGGRSRTDACSVREFGVALPP